MDLRISDEQQRGVPVLVPEGEVDRGTASVLSDHLGRLVGHLPTALVVDLSRLRFMDSTGVHVIVEADQVVHGYGGRLGVVAGTGHVRDVFVLAGAPLSVPLHRTREAAVSAVLGHRLTVG
ncbi:STAS domain-containing protein [Georgenia sp. 10Sc9-8]|uniref:STAS domain-containing protein n=1 Tax=Georgenia halotolerans TaxID=3028317 RepID=A0ABT5TUQ7_9MICO|nr:STAS domain-containing protein [Georgenia halotolerans]